MVLVSSQAQILITGVSGMSKMYWFIITMTLKCCASCVKGYQLLTFRHCRAGGEPGVKATPWASSPQCLLLAVLTLEKAW